MKKALMILVIGFALGSFGCEHSIYSPDLTPPSSPRGLYTETGDNLVELFWYENPETDVEGYRVYASSAYSGDYSYLGTTHSGHFIDYGARNGETYYYAVSAFDYSGNESELSRDVAYDTPRPEGYDVRLRDFRTIPGLAGYDFSTYSVGPYDDNYTDVFFENYGGNLYLNVWEDTDIQDMGYTTSLYDIREAPDRGWSPTKDARLIVGHTYIIWTWDDHYAKLRVISASPGAVVFDWTYQLQKANPRLKRAVAPNRSELGMGSGVLSRK